MPEYDRKRIRRAAPRRRKKKQNVFAALVTGLFPWKGDNAGTVVRKIVFLVSLAMIMVSAFMLIDFYFIRDIRMKQQLDALSKMKSDYNGSERIKLRLGDVRPGISSDDNEEVEVIGEYLESYNRNNDFVGWIKIYPIIDYPVLQTTDNEFYLNHNYDKIPTENGTIFTDYEGIFTPTERPHNIIIYGHNLITKYFFQPLVNYRDSFEFLQQRPYIEFDTLYERGTYKIFAVFLTNTDPEKGEVFRYWDNVYFNTKEEFDNYVAECLDRSYYYTGVDLEYGDELIMLSTCDFSIYRDDIRLVVVGRRVRENESPLVDTEKFINNKGTDENGYLKRKMFENYYNIYGAKGWAGRNWDPAYIKDFANY